MGSCVPAIAESKAPIPTTLPPQKRKNKATDEKYEVLWTSVSLATEHHISPLPKFRQVRNASLRMKNYVAGAVNASSFPCGYVIAPKETVRKEPIFPFF